MIKTMLLGYDGSEPSKKALDVAIKFAKQLGAKLYILYVINVDVTTELFGEYRGKIAEELMDKAKKLVNEAVEKAKSEGVDAEGLVEAGVPAEKIVEVAKNKNADLIVVGAHGYGGVKKLLIGSVSEKVIRLSVRPVLVVKGE